MLVVDHLAKTYGASGPGAVEAIRDISFEVAPREFVCIVGPSGGGKTTLLRCLCGLHPASGGCVALDGKVIEEPPPKMAAVFQDYSRSLMPWYTIERNIELPLRNRIKDKEERAARVAAALREVALGGFGERHPWELSGGMQQRAAIARAIAYQPEILIMDEPFASVDAQTRFDLEDLILSVRQHSGTAVVFVTHDIDEAVYLGDRVVVLSSRPATVLEVLEIDLPEPRDQLTTRSLRRFADHRTRVLERIRETTSRVEDSDMSDRDGEPRLVAGPENVHAP
jgi:NitT/TauT family transport system ATP-binding protein